jgi:hypothetical protein
LIIDQGFVFDTFICNPCRRFGEHDKCRSDSRGISSNIEVAPVICLALPLFFRFVKATDWMSRSRIDEELSFVSADLSKWGDLGL